MNIIQSSFKPVILSDNNHGILGFITFTTDEFHFTSIALRISKENKLYLLFPKSGQNQAVWPINALTYDCILSHILSDENNMSKIKKQLELKKGKVNE